MLLAAAAESSVTASTLHDGTALKEALVWRILQRIRLTDMNLNINKALLKVFDYMDKGNNKELTMQEFCDGINSEVLNMSWTDQQTRQLFKVLWVLRVLTSASSVHSTLCYGVSPIFAIMRAQRPSTIACGLFWRW